MENALLHLTKVHGKMINTFLKSSQASESLLLKMIQVKWYGEDKAPIINPISLKYTIIEVGEVFWMEFKQSCMEGTLLRDNETKPMIDMSDFMLIYYFWKDR